MIYTVHKILQICTCIAAVDTMGIILHSLLCKVARSVTHRLHHCLETLTKIARHFTLNGIEDISLRDLEGLEGTS